MHPPHEPAKHEAHAPPDSTRRTLAEFLRKNRARAIAEWERVIAAAPAAALLDADELRDHMPSLIDRVVEIVEAPGPPSPLAELAEQHALVRMEEGFNLEQVAWEYSMLRRTLLSLNEQGKKRLDPHAIVLLNDAIDQAVVRAVGRYHRARVRMLEALDRIAQEGLLAEPHALDALLRRLLDVIISSVDAVDTAVLFLRDWDRLILRAGVGVERELEGNFSLAIGEGFAGMVALTRRPLMTHAAEADPLVRNPVLRLHGVKALYGVPLIYGDEVVGVAKMGSRKASDFPADDRRVLRSAAERAAAFIAHRRETDDRELLMHILGHDLRSPLNTIVMGAYSVRQREALSPPVSSTLDRVVAAANRMAGIIDNLTDYTQTRVTGHLPLHRERLDLRELVTDVVREIQARSEREIHVEDAGDLTGEWDRGRIMRALVNLINNAFAYGAPSTPVTIELRGDGPGVRLSVHNEGEPIPEDLAPQLFEAFKRGNRGVGSGLGLFIVREIVRAHGGTIDVASSAGRGTTFAMELPRAAPESS